MEQKFKAQLTAMGPKGAWTFLPIPFDVQQVFGTKARVSVTGTINGYPFRNSLMPRGDGTHFMMVGKELKAGAKATAGSLVEVTMEADKTERVVEVPDELRAALTRDKKAGAAFRALAYSHQKAYADWIAGAKKVETKASRAKKALEMLVAGRKLG
jgi:hypothetical protein